MNLKSPKSIRIGGTEYAIVDTPELNNGTNIAYGYIDFEKSRIEITSSIEMSSARRFETLLHEILHGIIYHRSMIVKNEEELVDNLAKGAAQVVLDNWNRFIDQEE